MSAGAAEVRPHATSDVLRGGGAIASGVLFVLAIIPWSGRNEAVATSQFAALAMVVPALFVAGAPWQVLSRGGGARSWPARALASLATRRRARRGVPRIVAILALDVAVMVAWRTPVLVDALVRTPVLVLVESATLVVAGILLWLELIESPPFTPSCSRPRRAVVAALAMWSVWIVAYLEGMSHAGWYDAFGHAPGSGLSAVADRELSAAILWAVSAAVFMPVVFWNVAAWLSAEGAREDDRGADLAGTRLAHSSRRDGAAPERS